MTPATHTVDVTLSGHILDLRRADGYTQLRVRDVDGIAIRDFVVTCPNAICDPTLQEGDAVFVDATALVNSSDLDLTTGELEIHVDYIARSLALASECEPPPAAPTYHELTLASKPRHEFAATEIEVY